MGFTDLPPGGFFIHKTKLSFKNFTITSACLLLQWKKAGHLIFRFHPLKEGNVFVLPCHSASPSGEAVIRSQGPPVSSNLPVEPDKGDPGLPPYSPRHNPQQKHLDPSETRKNQ